MPCRCGSRSKALDAAVSTGGAPPAPAVRVEANVRDTLAALAARGLLVEQLGRLSGRLLEAAGPLLGGASAVRAEVGGGPEGVRTLNWTPIPGSSGGSDPLPMRRACCVLHLGLPPKNHLINFIDI